MDQSTSRLRPRFHWGVFGSYVPLWHTPGNIGNVFFEGGDNYMRGRDLRLGFVRGRQLGFELGVSYVRKTVTGVDAADESLPGQFPGQLPTVTRLSFNPVTMQGADAHVILPLKRLGERVQLGVLVGGGMAWLPDTPFEQIRIEGPPFYPDAGSATALPQPPATGGYVGEFPRVPLVPGTRYGIGETRLYDISPTDHFWMLLRGQLAADILVAPSLKVRVAGGFNYPGLQAAGVDVIYLFRTGTDPGTGRGAPLAGGPQIADRPEILAPRRSYWGVLGGFTPQWWVPRSWGPIFEPDVPGTVKGRDLRVGITRGRPLGYEFGVSFTQKTWTEFSLERQGNAVYPPAPPGQSAFSQPAQFARVTRSQAQPLQMRGAEFHALVPIARLGQRVMIGGLMGTGIATVPSSAVNKRIEGPPFVATPTGVEALATLPPAGGYVYDDAGQAHFVPPGQSGVTVQVDAKDTEVSPLGDVLLLVRGQIALDVLLAAPLKLRFSAGFNYPGAQAFGIEAVYLFGTGR